MTEDVLICHGDAVRLLRTWDVPPADAAVTSPPYLDARDDIAAVTGGLSYLAWSHEWLSALTAAVKPTGSLMLNLGRIHREGLESTWWIDVLQQARAAGWLLVDTLIWHKVNGGGGRRTPYLIDRHEYVLWLALDPRPYKGFDEARQPYAPESLARYRRRWAAHGGSVKGDTAKPGTGRTPHPEGAKAGSVFVSSVGAEKGIQHPTPMALDLAEHLVKLSCPPGGLVVDPFAGSGTTGVAARKLGRRATLIEADRAHCAEAAARLQQQALAV